MLHNNTITYSWTVPEFEFRSKSKQWYWIVGAVAIILIVLAVVLKNYLLGFFILLGTFLVFTHSTHEPKELEVEISMDGIRVQENMHRYDTIRAFWMKELNTGEVVLILLTSQNMTSLISVAVPPNIHPLELREFLLQYIEESELREPLTEKLIKVIGF